MCYDSYWAYEEFEGGRYNPIKGLFSSLLRTLLHAWSAVSNVRNRGYSESVDSLLHAH